MVNIHCSSRRKLYFLFSIFLSFAILQGCSSVELEHQVLPTSAPVDAKNHIDYRYIVGPGDTLNLFVWKNEEVSTSVIVRPDGFINAPLVDEIKVSGKTPSEVAELLTEAIAEYIREPIVTVTVSNFVGPYYEQVRVIGEAAEPKTLPYKEGMTLLDLIIAVDGLTEFADGNGALLSRIVEGKYEQYILRMDDLLQDGDLAANVDILPGDIIVIPESWF